MDIKTIAVIKDKAERLFAKGKLKEALSTYEEIRPYGRKDPRICLRAGDIMRKLDNGPGAIEAYKEAVDAFTKLGFIVKAIAVCKIIIQMDPNEEAIQKRLAGLYAKTSGEVGAAGETGSPIDEAITAEPVGEGEEGTAEKKPEKKRRPFPRAPLFSDLTREELFDVVRKVKFMELPQGSTLFKEGDRGDSIFIIVGGSLEVLNRAENGEDIQVAELKKDGEFFGEFGFFSNSLRTSTVRTTADTELLEITRSDMNEMIAKYPRVSRVLFDFYKERVVDRLLALSKVFRGINRDDRMEILKRLTLKNFKKGSCIVKEGEVGESMYLIKEGTAAAWVADEKGEKNMVGEISPGDFFGEIALATSRPRLASVSAVTDVSAVEFSKPTIKDILEKYPSVKAMFEEVIKERVADIMMAKKGSKTALL